MRDSNIADILVGLERRISALERITATITAAMEGDKQEGGDKPEDKDKQEDKKETNHDGGKNKQRSR